MTGARDVVVTGIGLVSSVGEGTAAHLAALDGGTRNVDARTFAPYPVHPAVAVNWDLQIAKKSDQRQMEAWQKLGVYAAGMALAEAGLKDNKELLSQIDVIVAAGGGERDYGVDEQILVGLKKSNAPRAFLNERLMSDVRPTLFLAQLSNLLAGNISIVHGVTGATRTFMGEEQAGVDVLRIAAARIAARQGDAFLIGGSYNAERPDIIMIYGMGRMLWRGDFVPVFDRTTDGGGFIPGSGGAFLVVEAREHAEKRGASPIATVRAIATNRVKRDAGAVGASLTKLWSQLVPSFDAKGGLILSGATGVAGITAEEQEALSKLAPGARLVATGDIFGHMIEAQFPAGVALAAAAVKAGKVSEAAVSNVGQLRGEGLALIGRAD
jgi:3-oxoacyl-[acyl-carrier-protein] synthase II